MSEWWTYGLSDFLMFSPRSHARLLATYHADRWPWQPVMAAAALVLLAGAGGRRRGTAGLLAALALAWLAVAVDFLARRYASIHLGAMPMAWAFAAQAGALLATAACTLRQAPAPPSSIPAWPRAVAALALVAAPAFGVLQAASEAASTSDSSAAVLAGPLPMPWEWVGFTPDATAVFTLALLPALCGRRRALAFALAVLPLATVAVGSATLHLLQRPLPWLPLAAGLAGFACSLLAAAGPPSETARPTVTRGLP